MQNRISGRSGLSAIGALALSAQLGCEFVVQPSGAPSTCQACGDLGADGAGAPDAAGPPLDPDAVGPYTVGTLELGLVVDAADPQGGVVGATVWGPGDGARIDAARGPFPLVLLTPAKWVDRDGSPSQYGDYARRLAGYGFVVVLQRPRDDGKLEQTQADTQRAVDFLRAPTTPAGKALAAALDLTRVGLLGHGQGGSLSVVAAAGTRARAVLAIDPVDAVGVPGAVQAIAGLALPGGAPVGLLGGTASKLPQPKVCAPDVLGFDELKRKAGDRALAIAFEGAGQGEFVDRYSDCVFCKDCPGSGAPLARTHRLAVKYTAAYFLWTLQARADAKEFLTGAPFQQDQRSGAVTAR